MSTILSLPNEIFAKTCCYLSEKDSARLLSTCRDLWERKGLIEEELRLAFKSKACFLIATCFATNPPVFESKFNLILQGMSLQNRQKADKELYDMLYLCAPSFSRLIEIFSTKIFRKLMDLNLEGRMTVCGDIFYNAMQKHTHLESSFSHMDRVNAKEKLFILGEWNRRCYSNNRSDNANENTLFALLYVAAKLKLTTLADLEIVRSWFHPNLECVVSFPGEAILCNWDLLLQHSGMQSFRVMSLEELDYVKSYFPDLFVDQCYADYLYQ